MLVSGEREGSVDYPPVPLQGSVPAVAALVKLLYRGDELIAVDPSYDCGQPGHQAHRVLGPGQLEAADLLPLPGLQVQELGTGQDLVLPPEAAGDEDPGAGFQLNEETGVISPGGQHHRELRPAVGDGVQLVHLVQTLCYRLAQCQCEGQLSVPVSLL